MVKANRSTVSICVSVLAIVSTLVFVGSVDVSSMHTTVVGKTANQPVIDVELDELAVSFTRKGPFAFEKVPPSVRELDRKRIRIRGYMYPACEETGITEFMFNGEARSKTCSWAASLNYVPLHYYIEVSILEGHRVDYSYEPFVVEESFRIEPVIIDDELFILFRIEDATLKPVNRRVGYHSALRLVC